jgi:hypothetical protein
MPKRTNTFQQLIHLIYEQLAPEGAIVTESAVLIESTTNSDREIDILIEYEIVGMQQRIAIECRARSRKETEEWIDGLIGKYADLKVNQVIAVSKSGFSLNALAKAAANGIVTKTLEEAIDTSWPKELIKPGFSYVVGSTSVESVEIEVEPKPVDPISADDDVLDIDGHRAGSLGDVLRGCYETKILPELNQHVKAHFYEIFKVLEDFKKDLYVRQRVLPVSKVISQKGGATYKFTAAIFYTRTTYKYSVAQMDDFSFDKGKALVSIGKVNAPDNKESIEIRIAQSPNSNTAKLQLRRRNNKHK